MPTPEADGVALSGSDDSVPAVNDRKEIGLDT